MARPTEVLLEPLDNERLANLCGVLDENLRQIETAYDITIARRGERLTLQGHPAQAQLAAKALREFYTQAEHHLTVDDIQLGLIEFANRRQSDQPAPALLTRKTELHGRTPRQVDYLRNIQAHDITFGIGPAGTGKTYLAVAKAIEAMKGGQVRRLVLVRPAVEAGEKLGFLPGDFQAKIDPYLRPMHDALQDLLDTRTRVRWFESDAVEVCPLAYMRGRTLNHAFVILDEAQNTTVPQMLMFLTRLGEASRMVVTGDPSQVDLPGNVTSGLADALRRLDGVESIGVTRLSAADVVRHPVVSRIVTAYEASAAAAAAARQSAP